VQLTEPIVLDGVRAGAIRLLPQDTPAVTGTPTQVSGWGLIKMYGIAPGPLLKADVPIIDYDECQALYDGHLLLLPNEICAGTAGNLMDACEGDTVVAPSSTTAPSSASPPMATIVAPPIPRAYTQMPPVTLNGLCKILASLPLHRKPKNCAF